MKIFLAKIPLNIMHNEVSLLLKEHFSSFQLELLLDLKSLLIHDASTSSPHIETFTPLPQNMKKNVDPHTKS